MQTHLETIRLGKIKTGIAFVSLLVSLILAGLPANAQSGNTNNGNTKQEPNPMHEGADMDKGTYTQKDSVRGKAYGNTGTTGVIQDTVRSGQRSSQSGNQTGGLGNTGSSMDSSRTNGQQMSNSGNRNDTLMGPTGGSSNTGTKSSGSRHKSGKNTRSGNQPD